MPVNGFRKRNDKWYIRLRLQDNRVTEIAAFKSKKASQALVDRIDEIMAINATGLPLPVDIIKWIHHLPKSIVRKLTKLNIVDGHTAQAIEPMTEHINTWRQDLEARCIDRYVRDIVECVVHLADGCGWTLITHINVRAAETWILEQRVGIQHEHTGQPLSVRRRNQYRRSLKQFCRWCVREKIIVSNPVENMKLEPDHEEPRQKKRVPSKSELDTLFSTMLDLGKQRANLDAPTRVLFYRMLCLTGLRIGEARQIERRDFHLDAPHPYIDVRMEVSKSRRAAKLPIQATLVDKIRERIRDMSPRERVFQTPDKLSKDLRKDLHDAGIPRLSDDGRFTCHSFRHYFGTILALKGTPPAIHMKLMRHSRIDMTMKYYTHIELEDTASAIEGLGL